MNVAGRAVSATLLFAVTTMPVAAQDALAVAASRSSSTTIEVPVYAKDVSGTPLGSDQPASSRVQAFGFKVAYTPAAAVSSVTFARAGVLAALTPMYERSVASAGALGWVGSFSASANEVPLTLNAAGAGNLIGKLRFEIARPGDRISLSIDSATATFSNQSGTLAETVGNSGLVLSGATIYMMVPVHGDYDGDGRDDVLLRDTTNGDLSVWLMNGATIKASGVAGSPGAYAVVGVGDLDGDQKSDIVLRDALGNIGAWLMNGTAIAAGGLIGSPGGYTVTATADFDGDARADILLRDSLGNVGLWFMNGTVITAGAAVGSPGAYTIAAAADFTADGKADLILQDAGGNIGMWVMNGAAIASGGFVGSPAGYSVVGANDYDGDSKADLVLRDALGNIGMWFLNGPSIAGGALVGSPAGYTVVAAGDYNGNATGDILLRDDSGNIGVWLMNGSAITAGALLGSPGAKFEAF